MHLVNLFIDCTLSSPGVFALSFVVKITHSHVGEIPVIHLIGRLDFMTSPILENQLNLLLESKIHHLVFDCSELTYVSSASLRLFISTLRQLHKQRERVAVAALKQSVSDLFRLARLNGLFLIQDTVEEDVASVNHQ